MAGVGLVAVVLGGFGCDAAVAQEVQTSLEPAISIPAIWWIAPIGSIIALIFAWVFYKGMMASNEGDQDMIDIAAYVRDGAFAYLKQQYKVVTGFFILVSVILFIMAFVFKVQHEIVFVAFLT
ncbi:MAG: sodium/proton-translocating pyrophosphatase, partial [Phycisphaerae bacterium]